MDDYVSFSADKTMSCMMNELSFDYVRFLAVQFFSRDYYRGQPSRHSVKGLVHRSSHPLPGNEQEEWQLS